MILRLLFFETNFGDLSPEYDNEKKVQREGRQRERDLLLGWSRAVVEVSVFVFGEGLGDEKGENDGGLAVDLHRLRSSEKTLAMKKISNGVEIDIPKVVNQAGLKSEGV